MEGDALGKEQSRDRERVWEGGEREEKKKRLRRLWRECVAFCCHMALLHSSCSRLREEAASIRATSLPPKGQGRANEPAIYYIRLAKSGIALGRFLVWPTCFLLFLIRGEKQSFPM